MYTFLFVFSVGEWEGGVWIGTDVGVLPPRLHGALLEHVLLLLDQRRTDRLCGAGTVCAIGRCFCGRHFGAGTGEC